ncbi:GDSL esterase/lipase, partial [Trifolium medium]|nr:GDSL esterase/lipase [Trifolium medium]
TEPPFKSSLPRPEEFSKALYTIDIGQNDPAYGFQHTSEEQVQRSIPDILSQFSEAVKVWAGFAEAGGRISLVSVPFCSSLYDLPLPLARVPCNFSVQRLISLPKEMLGFMIFFEMTLFCFSIATADLIWFPSVSR